MIYIQTETFRIDISRYGVNLNEESDLFSDSVNKNYSLPFTITGDEELLIKLGLVHLQNASNIDVQIPCWLVLPDQYYKANLFIGEINGIKIECTLTYGNEDLPVYDRELRELSWPKIVTDNLLQYAKEKIQSNWPSSAFNFPMVYKPKIAEGDNYKEFLGFVNNFQDGRFVENIIDNSGEEAKYLNRNVMVPFPYLLEIIRFIYAQEGKKVFGPVMNHPTLKKALYIPKNYLEKFRGTEYQQWSFSYPSEDRVENNEAFSVYERAISPNVIGSYEIDYSIQFDSVQAQYFKFSIQTEDALTKERTILKEASSANNRVKLDDKFTVTIEKNNQYDKIVIQLILKPQNLSIEESNNFEFSFKGGQLNQFPNVFSLADFVPDMKAGEFINILKNWWNLKIDIQDRFVVIDFAKNAVLQMPVRDHSHLEDPDKKFQHNSNRFYTLSYANKDAYYYNKKGRVYAKEINENTEEVEIDLKVQPAEVESINGIVTAIAPEKETDIDFCLYAGTDTSGSPACALNISRDLSLDKIGPEFWDPWLWFRIHSKTFKDSIECSTHEIYDIKELSFKYNEKQIIKKISKKFQSEKVMKVEVESESF